MFRLCPRLLATCPKSNDDPQRNEDAVRIAVDGSLVAMSDGASESYDSRLWARLLCDIAVARGLPTRPRAYREALHTALTEYAASFDRTQMSWSQEAAFDRGSFASLLCIASCRTEPALVVASIGDTTAFLVERGAITDTFSYVKSAEFDAHPDLLCTARSSNAWPNVRLGASLRALSRRRKSGTLHRVWHPSDVSTTTVVCATDAVARWAIEGTELGDDRIGCLLELTSESAFSELVVAEREFGRMRRDDSTVAVLEIVDEAADA